MYISHFLYMGSSSDKTYTNGDTNGEDSGPRFHEMPIAKIEFPKKPVPKKISASGL